MTYIPYNTGNELGSPDPRDSSDNKSFFDEFANSTSHTYADRFGVTRLTMRGALARYASVVAKGDWTAATAYNQNDLWVDPDSGIIYIVLDDYTSGASADDDIAVGAVAVYQGPVKDNEAVTTKVVVSGALPIDATKDKVVYVLLTEDITNLSITTPPPGEQTEVTVYFEQDATGFRSVTLPANISITSNNTDLIGMVPRDLTIVKLVSKGSEWQWVVDGVKAPVSGLYSSTPRQNGWVMPSFNENTLFNDECNSTAGWNPASVTVSQQSASVVRLAFPSSGYGNASKTFTSIASNRDHITYLRVKGSSSGGCAISATPSSSEDLIYSVTLGEGSSGSEVGSVGVNTANGSFYFKYDYVSEWLDIAVHYETKYNAVYLYRRTTGESVNWTLIDRVKVTTGQVGRILFFGTNINVDVDFISVCKPNIIAIGDSVCEGIPHFNMNINSYPNDKNYANTWLYHCQIYKKMRNNIIVNKGVSGNNSPMMKARFVADVTNHGPRLVLFGTSSNDGYYMQVSYATRTSDIQWCISTAKSAGADTLLLAPMNGALATFPYPHSAIYNRGWSLGYLSSLVDHIGFIDISVAVRSEFDDYMDDIYANDPGHPNAKGFQKIGRMISALGRKL